MRTHLLALLAASAVAVSAAPAAAQAWLTINERQARLDERIERGVATGALTRDEAYRLRSDFRALADLEARYRVGGLTLSERDDLDRRFDGLAGRIGDEARDYDRGWNDRDDDRPDWSAGGWSDLADRAEDLRRRIDLARRDGRLTAPEAGRLRADLDLLLRDEAGYRAELDRRLDLLSDRVRDGRPGYGD